MTSAAVADLAREHEAIARRVEDLDLLACAAGGDADALRRAVRCAREFIVDRVLPHARAEEEAASRHPRRTAAGLTSSLQRDHQAIAVVADELASLGEGAFTAARQAEVRRLFLAVEALTRLHLRREAGLCGASVQRRDLGAVDTTPHHTGEQ